MIAIELNEKVELQVLYTLAIEGKFLSYVDKEELMFSPITNSVIENILNKYATNDWDPRNFYIEDYLLFLDCIKNGLRQISNKEFMEIQDKNNFIKSMAYPFRIKEETINQLIQERIDNKICENCFEFNNLICSTIKNNDVCYKITTKGKIKINGISDLTFSIINYYKDIGNKNKE